MTGFKSCQSCSEPHKEHTGLICPFIGSLCQGCAPCMCLTANAYLGRRLTGVPNCMLKEAASTRSIISLRSWLVGTSSCMSVGSCLMTRPWLEEAGNLSLDFPLPAEEFSVSFQGHQDISLLVANCQILISLAIVSSHESKRGCTLPMQAGHIQSS